jgi:hypothetical protein
MVITEDSVTGSASGYAQKNYYSSQSQNIPLTGAGHNWQTEPATVPANKMRYDFVAREIVGGFSGQAGSLPSSIPDGSTQTYAFTSGALINVIRPAKLYAHILLFDAANKMILNGKSVQVTSVTGISQTEAVNNLSFYPNPVQNQLNVNFGLIDNEPVSVSVVNTLGQTVLTEATQNLAPGNHELKVNTSTLSSGVYFIQVGTSKGVVSQRFVKAE